MAVLLAWVALAAGARGALIVHEPFSYTDGPLVSVAQGVWSTYSGTSNQLAVLDGRVRLAETNSEDAQVFLPGRPFTNGALYLSFKFHVARQPTGGGGCFALLKDSGVNNNRACIYASSAYSPAGHYRLGMRLTGVTSPLYAWYLPVDLPVGQEQWVVVRYEVNPPAAMLWLNPANEHAEGLAVPNDGTAPLAVHAFALRQSLASGNGMGMMTLDSLRIGTTFAEVATAGAPPTLAAIPDLALPSGGVSEAIPLHVSDEDTPLPFIFLYALSDQPDLIPPDAVIFGGAGGERSMIVQTVPGRQGVARLTVVALDDTGLSTPRAFTVRIGAPELSAPADQVIRVNETLIDLPVRVWDPEGDPLSLTATAADRTLFPATNIVLAGTGETRRLTLRPAPERGGYSLITLTLSDGWHSVTSRFSVTVAPRLGRLLEEEFDYLDGSLTSSGQLGWQSHSGVEGQTQVRDGRLWLNMSQSEDVSAFLAGQPFSTGSGVMLYARLDVRVTGLPTNSAPAYFAHYKDGGANYRARLFITTNGAPAGGFRLGLSSAATAPSVIAPVDLATQTLHTVVTRFNVNNGASALWINPARESDPAHAATDPAGNAAVVALALRQAANIGVLEIERVWVGTAFEDVVTPPPQLFFHQAGRQVVLRWQARAGWLLESTPHWTGAPWREVTPAPTADDGWCAVTNACEGATHFFRLRARE